VSRIEDVSLYRSADNEYWFDNRTLGCKVARPLPPVTEAHLAIATARLRRISLIGLVEQMDEAMALWRSTLALELDGSGAVRNHCSSIRPSLRVCGNSNHRVCGNATGVREQLLQQQPEAYTQLLHDNRFSVRLYARAKALFALQMRSANQGSGMVSRHAH
jgi:hypothetical protein